jgi:hypothetical protein
MNEARGHVEIRPNDEGGWHLFVDGTDLGMSVSSASVRWEGHTPHVSLEVVPWRSLKLDLPDAVLHIIDADQEPRP